MNQDQQLREAFPERDTTKPAEQQGVFRKFVVQRVDGSDCPGGKHEGCEYFVLDVDHDQHAKAALTAYANAVEATHPALAKDMRERYALTATQQAAPSQGAEIIAKGLEHVSELLAGHMRAMVAATKTKDGKVSAFATFSKFNSVRHRVQSLKKQTSALLESSAQREQPAASKPEPQAQAGEPAPVQFHDHPDLVGGVRWSELELKWIEERDQQWRQYHCEAMTEVMSQRDDAEGRFHIAFEECAAKNTAIAKKDAALKACVEAGDAVMKASDELSRCERPSAAFALTEARLVRRINDLGAAITQGQGALK